jgi:hypothetical protein
MFCAVVVPTRLTSALLKKDHERLAFIMTPNLESLDGSEGYRSDTHCRAVCAVMQT